jgi:hypothetical protein
MVNLDSLIHIYENALESDVCDFLISLFEEVPEKQERIDNERKPNFTQFNLTENYKVTEKTEQVHNYLIQNTIRYRDEYYEMIGRKVFPEKHAFEQFRIKRYNNDGKDEFNTHVDVVDNSTSRRYLSFLWYLNDVNKGGETKFINKTITPKKGNLLVFPPLWMFPHSGLVPVSEPKYIAHTYLHYK